MISPSGKIVDLPLSWDVFTTTFPSLSTVWISSSISTWGYTHWPLSHTAQNSCLSTFYHGLAAPHQHPLSWDSRLGSLPQRSALWSFHQQLPQILTFTANLSLTLEARVSPLPQGEPSSYPLTLSWVLAASGLPHEHLLAASDVEWAMDRLPLLNGSSKL